MEWCVKRLVQGYKLFVGDLAPSMSKDNVYRWMANGGIHEKDIADVNMAY